jgi:hypothetical protein
MPAFGNVHTAQQIDDLVHCVVRGFAGSVTGYWNYCGPPYLKHVSLPFESIMYSMH